MSSGNVPRKSIAHTANKDPHLRRYSDHNPYFQNSYELMPPILEPDESNQKGKKGTANNTSIGLKLKTRLQNPSQFSDLNAQKTGPFRDQAGCELSRLSAALNL